VKIGLGPDEIQHVSSRAVLAIPDHGLGPGELGGDAVDDVGDRPAGASFATRSAAMGLNGAAGTAHPLATQTAIDILKRGGSAADAAIAANAVLGFVEPVSSGLGGDCYAFVWDPKTQKLEGMASSGASPKGLSLETVQQHSVVVDGKVELLEFFAQRRACDDQDRGMACSVAGALVRGVRNALLNVMPLWLALAWWLAR